MAVYFAPSDSYSSRSGSLGTVIGKSLANTIGELTQEKAAQLKRQRGAETISQGLIAQGVPSHVAEKIAMMPPQHQQMFMKQFFGSQAFAPQQGQVTQEAQRVSDLEGMLSPLQQQPQQQQPQQMQPQQMQPQQMPQEQMQQPQMQQLLQGLQGDTSMLPSLSPEVQQQLQEDAAKQKFISSVPEEHRPALMQRAEVEDKREAVPNTISAAIRQSPLQSKPAAKKTFQELLATPRLTSADRTKLETLRRKDAKEEKKMDLAERKFKYKKQESIDKLTQKDYDLIKDRYKGAIENDWRLDKLDELVKKGNLEKPTTAALLKAAGLKGFGIDLSSLMNADSQEFQKISNDFIKNAKAIFGARVTEGEIRLFLQTVPNLMQTDEGKRRIIRNMKLFNQADKARFKAMNEIIEMNGGERPKNLVSLVEKKVKPQLDVIGKKYAEILHAAPKTKKERASVLRSMLDPFTSKEEFPSLSELAGGALKSTGKMLKLPIWAIKEIVSGAFS